MRLVLLREIPEDADLRRQWNALVLQSEDPQVFHTYEWSLAVDRAYRETLPPLLFLSFDQQDALIGVAALAGDPGGKGASFLCATTGDYCDFLGSPEDRPAFVAAVLAELRKMGIDEIRLANLPADSATVAALRQGGRTCQYHVFARTGYICARVELQSLERRGDDKPVLPRKKMVRRFLNAMGRQTPVRLDHARSWEAIEPLLPEFMQAHVARFLVTGRISNMARLERQRFLKELARLLAEPGWIALTRMTSGEKNFAWNYGFQFQQTWFWYQPTFDSDLEKYSPGFCLLAKLIEESADSSEVKIVDLGLGAEEYKDRFANQTREILYVVLNSFPARHYRERLRYWAAELVRQSSWVERFVRTLATKLSRGREQRKQRGIRATVFWLCRRLRELLWLDHEVFFYEWSRPLLSRSNDLQLQSLDLKELVLSASQYVHDRETLDYLLRAASRLRAQKAEGFVLKDAAGTCLHFAWAADFEGFFLAELNAAVSAPSADSIMVFDCWTPVSVRGRNYYAQAVERIAALIQDRGRQPWIFSAATNRGSVRGLSATGFVRRYSLWRRRLLGLQWISGQTPHSTPSPASQVTAQT